MLDKHASHWLEREDQGDLTIVRFRTTRLMDDDLTRDVFDEIYALVEDLDRRYLLLDFAQVDYLSSLALGKLVMLNRKVQAAVGRLALCSLNEDIREVFAITHLINLFYTYVNEGQAVQSFPVMQGQVV
jgi:anti-sigma B factor antagonist